MWWQIKTYFYISIHKEVLFHTRIRIWPPTNLDIVGLNDLLCVWWLTLMPSYIKIPPYIGNLYKAQNFYKYSQGLMFEIQIWPWPWDAEPVHDTLFKEG